MQLIDFCNLEITEINLLTQKSIGNQVDFEISYAILASVEPPRLIAYN